MSNGSANRLTRLAVGLVQDFGRAMLRGALPGHRRNETGNRPQRRATSPDAPSGVPREGRRANDTAPRIEYAPRTNGVPDPGEMVWAWVPYEEDPSRGKDRPVLVIGREGAQLLALPATSKDHDRDADQEARAGRYWMDIGSGAWDSRRRPSEVRLDRVLRLDPGEVRREGAALDQRTFEQVIEGMRAHR